MCDFWKSNERHYCKICKSWMGGDKMSIRLHEEGQYHKNNSERWIKDMYSNHRKSQKEEKMLMKEIERLNRIAGSGTNKMSEESRKTLAALGITATSTTEIVRAEPVSHKERQEAKLRERAAKFQSQMADAMKSGDTSSSAMAARKARKATEQKKREAEREKHVPDNKIKRKTLGAKAEIRTPLAINENTGISGWSVVEVEETPQSAYEREHTKEMDIPEEEFKGVIFDGEEEVRFGYRDNPFEKDDEDEMKEKERREEQYRLSEERKKVLQAGEISRKVQWVDVTDEPKQRMNWRDLDDPEAVKEKPKAVEPPSRVHKDEAKSAPTWKQPKLALPKEDTTDDTPVLAFKKRKGARAPRSARKTTSEIVAESY
eukprot:TRINITY_DN25862_c0_g1_i1.p1 TRINITY_DN25862_c0_g1~~TRINITY_DN25862_c0_g1_i1.p1  ORF type:complete len:373 (-),score=99.06 TRINITY_DN25862_c0_g1_i1:42-1160(-)